MVVCKFFLQGTCKFGSYCHFDHSVPGNTHGISVLRQSHFEAPQTAKPTQQNVDTNMLVKSLVNDMTLSEKGGQWIFSCYAPFKEKPAFPGFEDQSFEEIRFGFYQARNNGILDQYKQQLQLLYEETIRKIRALQNPSQEVVNLLQKIYNSPPSNSYASATTTQIGSNIFSSQNASSNIFANFTKQSTPAPTNIFARAPQNNNFFTQQQPTTQTQNIFNNPQPNIFANKPETSFFQNNQQSGSFPNRNMFVTEAPKPANIFSSELSKPIFVPPNQVPQNQNIFFTDKTAAQHTSDIFGPQQIPPGIPLNYVGDKTIPLPNQQNIFNQFQNKPNQPASMFLVPSMPTITNVHSSGNSQPPIVDETLYSKLEDLNEDEKQWFEGDDLNILTIPEKPPTYDMCFRM